MAGKIIRLWLFLGALLTSLMRLRLAGLQFPGFSSSLIYAGTAYIGTGGSKHSSSHVWAGNVSPCLPAGLGSHVHFLRRSTSWCRCLGNHSTRRSRSCQMGYLSRTYRVSHVNCVNLKKRLPTATYPNSIAFINSSTCEPYAPSHMKHHHSHKTRKTQCVG